MPGYTGKPTKPYCSKGHEMTPQNTITAGQCRECRRQYQSKFLKKAYDELPDWYVRKEMGIKDKSFPPELIELKRNHILNKRALSQLKNAIGGI